jgi:alpha-1,3-mannosyltransferase
MQEVEGPLSHGDFNYEHLEGQTGPLVYPAGFVHLFALLRGLTSQGKDIFRAQMMFSAIHILLLAVVLFGIYSRVPDLPFSAPFLAVLSRRVHSIFELRLFNDGVAMLYAYTSVALAMRNKWTLACILFSLAVSIKMNVLLMAPGLAVVLVQANGLIGATLRVALCGAIQLLLAGPFLLVNPLGYLRRSFELGRVFLSKWTVNFKFLDEPTFQSPRLALALLAMTLLTWLLFGHFRWARSSGGLFKLVLRAPWFTNVKLSAEHVAVCLLESNLIGIVFARSMHYQFYAWYAHVIPLLVFRGSIGRRNFIAGLMLVLVIEICFNVFPATPISSLALQTANYALLVSSWFAPTTKHVIKD